MTSDVKLSANCIYGMFNGSFVPIAQGNGSLWQVGGRVFNEVEIVDSGNRKDAA